MPTPVKPLTYSHTLAPAPLSLIWSVHTLTVSVITDANLWAFYGKGFLRLMILLFSWYRMPTLKLRGPNTFTTEYSGVVTALSEKTHVILYIWSDKWPQNWPCAWKLEAMFSFSESGFFKTHDCVLFISIMLSLSRCFPSIWYSSLLFCFLHVRGLASFKQKKNF